MTHGYGNLQSMSMSMPGMSGGMAAPSQLINTQHLMQQPI